MRIAVVHNRDREGVINVFGPQNREKYNPRTVELVASALERGGHTVRVIDGNMNVVEQLEEFMPRVIAGERPGMVFNMAYGIQGVSRYTHLPAILEMLGVPYVGSNPLAHGLALDKIIAKIVFKNAGLPTPGFWSFASPDDRFEDLAFPAIVKPKMEAVSYGLRVVHDEQELREAVANIIEEFQQNVLVEQFIAGREFAIGLLGNGDPEVLPIVEIDFEGDPNAIQSADDKLRAPRGKLCPAPLSDEQTAELEALAKRAFNSLELYDFARVDLRMDAEGNPYILEINSMASLGLTGTYVHAAQTAGYSYDQLINRILDVAAIRYFGQDYLAGEAGEGAPPEGTSARVRHHVRSQEDTILESLRRMVELRTPPDEVERVNELGEWLTAQMRDLGFEAQVFSQVGIGNALYFRNHDDETDDVLLVSHLDTVPTETYVPFREEGNRVFGTGVAESKGGIAAALGALRALRYARAIRRIKCGFVVTTDDTRLGGRRLVGELAPKARFVLGLKNGDRDGGVVLSRAGRAKYRLEVVRRRTTRTIEAPKAVEHLLRRLIALEELDEEDERIRVGVTRVDLHAEPHRWPDVARAELAVLFTDGDTAATIDERVRAVAERRTTPGVRLRTIGGVQRQPMPRTEANESLFSIVERVAKRLNLRVQAAHRWDASDISQAPESVPRVDGLGPIGGGARTHGEYILRNSLVDRAALLALVMRECARGKP